MVFIMIDINNTLECVVVSGPAYLKRRWSWTRTKKKRKKPILMIQGLGVKGIWVKGV
jgi:hypothetical protein